MTTQTDKVIISGNRAGKMYNSLMCMIGVVLNGKTAILHSKDFVVLSRNYYEKLFPNPKLSSTTDDTLDYQIIDMPLPEPPKGDL